MLTPEGRECPYYYANFHRREQGVEVCRLLEDSPDAEAWTASLCATCEVPAIAQANSCRNMVYHARIGRRRFWESRRVLVRATCNLTHQPVKNPYVGCGQCHTLFDFVVIEESPPAP